MKRWMRSALLGAAVLVTVPVWAAGALQPAEFVWRGTLTVPEGASLARVALPADALVHLQSPDARDVRVFNAAGEAVAFAVDVPAVASPAPPATQTRAYAAHPLFAASPGQAPAKGAVAVQLDTGGGQSSVWVRFNDTGKTAEPVDGAATLLQSALFDTRAEKQAITALTLRADLPANTLVHFALASSADLKQWTPVAVRGPVFRFDGANAPTNQVLELSHALPLEGRYLRLSWEGQGGVTLQDITGSVAQTTAPPARVRAALPPGVQDGDTALKWPLDFATPLAGLQLRALRDNVLVPVRVWGRNDAAQPWRLLAQTVMYRVGTNGQERSNPSVDLRGASTRWLRLESTNGMPLAAGDVQATAEFSPVGVVFLASGIGPFELAVGRPQTPLAAMAPSLLSSVVAGRIDELPQALLSNVRVGLEAGAGSVLQRLLPAGTEQRSWVLWAILLGGVVVLGAVAYALFRQLSVAAK
jgi:hypothetical protein